MEEALSCDAGPGGPAVGSRISIKIADGKWLCAVLEAADSGTHPRFPFCLRYDTSGGGKAWVRFVNSHVLEAWQASKPRAKQAASADAVPPADAAAQALPFIVVPEGTKTKGRPTKEVTSLREEAEAALEGHLQQVQQQQPGEVDVAQGSPPKKRRIARSKLAHHAEQGTASNGFNSKPGSKQQQEAAAASEGAEDCAQQGAGKPRHAPATHDAAEEQAAAAEAADASLMARQAADGPVQFAANISSQDAVRGVSPAPLLTQSAVTEVGGSSFAPLATVAVSARPAVQASADDRKWRDSDRSASRASRLDASQDCARKASLQRDDPASQAAAEAQHAGAVEDGDAGMAAPAPTPPPQRPWESACREFAQLLPGLTLLKGSINTAASAAIRAGQQGGCKEVVRSVLEHMRREPAAFKRVVHFYLLDAVLAFSRRDVEGCGPGSPVGTLFPRTVGAALSQLVDLLAASQEAAQKMERTLTRTWLASDKRGVEASLVQRALEMLRDRLAQHAADWGDGDGGRGEGGGSMARVAPVGQGRAAGSTPALGTGLPGGPPLDEAQLWRLVRRTPLRAAPMLTYVDVRDGSRVRLTHVWHPPCWPDYDALPLDPDAAQQQFPAKLATAAAARNGGADVGEPSSPWHQAYARRQAAASEAWAEEQQRKQGLGDGEVAAQAARLAAAQRAAQQALRGRQSTAAAADVDEFDAGLFREVAGGVAPSAADQPPYGQPLPGLLGDMGWGGGTSLQPPLPGQPPPLPDEDGWGCDDEDAFGPPPLPPHSPPKDEYRLEETPPPLPPEEGVAGAPPPLPPPKPSQGATPAAAATPLGHQGGPAGGYGTPLDYAAGMPPPHAAAQGPAGWAGRQSAGATQHGMMPLGIGVAPGPSPAMLQQQAWMAHHQQQQLQHQRHHQQQQHGFMQQHQPAHQQRAQMMMGFSPVAMAGVQQQQQQQQQMMFSPMTAPGPLNPAMLLQPHMLPPGITGRPQPTSLPPPT